MQLDAKALASQAVGPLKIALQDAIKKDTPAAKALVSSIKNYEDDMAQSVKALQEQTDPTAAALLVEDITRFLPARRQAIVSQAANLTGDFIEDVLLAALGIAEGIAFTVARAYVPALAGVPLETFANQLNKKIKEG
jgi:hypothetical protein